MLIKTNELAIMLSLKRDKVTKMTTLFIDLDENEVMDKVLSLVDEYEVVDEGSNGHVAYVNGGWLPNTYQKEDDAYRAILAYVVGERALFSEES